MQVCLADHGHSSGTRQRGGRCHANLPGVASLLTPWKKVEPEEGRSLRQSREAAQEVSGTVGTAWLWFALAAAHPAAKSISSPAEFSYFPRVPVRGCDSVCPLHNERMCSVLQTFAKLC